MNNKGRDARSTLEIMKSARTSILRVKGFTLIELLVVLGILGILDYLSSLSSLSILSILDNFNI